MIAALRHAFSFPLLGKDLAERAARGRTYWIRLAFGVGLAAWFVVEMYRLSNGSQYIEARAVAETGTSLLGTAFQPRTGIDPSVAGFALMGIGKDLFERLMLVLCWAILLLQPALMASAITYEKERASLDLLLLTNASPTKLLLEKFFAGLVPMATLLLFGLPLGAVAYAYGGVTPAMLATACAVLLGAWLQTGAFALLCSAWCRSTTTAIVASYVGLAGFFAATEWGLAKLWAVPAGTSAAGVWTQYPPLAGLADTPLPDGEADDDPITWETKPWARWVPYTLFPPAALKGAGLVSSFEASNQRMLNAVEVEFEGFINYGSPIQSYSTNALGKRVKNVIRPSIINQPIFSTRRARDGILSPVAVAYRDIAVPAAQPSAIASASAPPAGDWSSFARRHGALPAAAILFLLLARAFLLRRAFAVPRETWARLFMRLDAKFTRVNRRLAGVDFAQHATFPPAGQPILWREAHKGMLGQSQHVMWLGAMWFIVLTFSALPAMIRFNAKSRADSSLEYVHLVGSVAVIVAVFALLIRAVTVIAADRADQTLEVLLTTPLRRRDIIRQKSRPLRWLMLALLLPLCALAGMTAWVGRNANATLDISQPATSSTAVVWFHFGVMAAGVAILLWQMRWLGFWCGLRVVSRGRAILVGLGIGAAWMLAPDFAGRMIESLLGTEWQRCALWVRQLSPIGLLELAVRGNVVVLTSTTYGRIVSAADVIPGVVAILFFHAFVAFTLRTACLWRAEKCLHRG